MTTFAQDCCANPQEPCQHRLVSAASREAQQLSSAERDIIMAVLKRNEQLQRDQQHRIMRLKAELQNLRRKGALRTTSADGGDSSMAGGSSLDPERTCGRCRVELGRVINRGAYCRACRLKVCKVCREYSLRTTDWVCTVCYKHMEIQAASGEWMNEFVRRPSRRRDNRVYVPAADLIKRTIRRSWTISNPSPRWNAPRESVEIRPYCSLPRGQDFGNYPVLVVRRASAMTISTGPTEKAQTKPPHMQPPMVLLPSPNLLEPPDRRHSPARRSHSEDVYIERIGSSDSSDVKITPLPPPGLTPENPLPSKQISTSPKSPSPHSDFPRPIRINPLIKYASERKKEPKKQHTLSTSSSEDRGKGDQSPDDRKTQSCRVRENSPAKRNEASGSSLLHEKKKLLSVVGMSVVAANVGCAGSSRSESEDEEVQNYMLGGSSVPGRSTRRKPFLQHTRTEQSCDLDMGRIGNSAFRSLDAGESMAGARRMSEKRVSFDKNVETSSSDSTPTARPFAKPSHKPEDFLRSTKRKLPHNTSTSTTLTEVTQHPSAATTTSGNPSLLPTTSICSNDNNSRNTNSSGNVASGIVADNQVPEAETPPELCDIEPISGTVFRKVTVRRRRQDMRKMAAVDNGWRSKPGLGDNSDHLESSSVDGEDYKLVFISSDSSSSKDEDLEDNDSSSTASSFPVDECDWDYFEPGSNAKPLGNWTSPFGSPRVCRRNATVSESSSLGSPLVYRKSVHHRESDPGTDEDSAKYFDSGSSDISLNAVAGSHTMADDWIQCALNAKSKTSVTAFITANATCQNCGANPQYVPVPVPIPIPVPVPAIWNAQDCLVRYAPDALEQAMRSQLRVLPRGLWPFINQAALIWPLISAAAAAASMPTDQSSGNSPLWSLLKTCTMHEESAAEGSEQHIKNSTTTATIAGTSSSTIASSSVSERNTARATAISSSNATTDHCQNTCIPQRIRVEIADECIKKQDVETEVVEMEVQGYLISESSKYDTSTDSANSSTEDDGTTCSSKNKRQTSGSYDVNVSNSSGDSDEALDVSEIEELEAEEDGRQSKISMDQEDNDTSSSGSADTDTDDTGTVADRKPKRFTRVFVINKGAYSSSDEESVTSKSDDDTSDNDTDVERDCGIILTCMKPLMCGDDEDIKQSDDIENNSSESEPVILLKRTELNNEFIDVNRKTVDLKDIFDDPPGNSVNFVNISVAEVNDAIVFDTNATTGNIETDILKDSTENVKEKLCDYTSSPCLSDVSAESLNSSDAEPLRDSNKSHSSDTNTSNTAYNGAIIPSDGIAGTPCDTHLSTTYGTTTECDASDHENHEVSEARIRSAATQRNSGVDCNRDCNSDDRSGTPIEGEQQVVERDNRAGVPVSNDGESECVGVGAGSTTTQNNSINSCVSTRHAATRYTSLVMITQESAPAPYRSSQVSVVTTDTTTLVPGTDVVVQHTNEHDITLADLDHCSTSTNIAANNNTTMVCPSSPDNSIVEQAEDNKERDGGENVTVITGADTLSAVVCLEEGLADDDSWVENLSHDDEDDDDDDLTSPEDTSSSEEVTLYCTAASDREDDLRGYHRAAIDFTLHTILEESCEESEVESLGHGNANRKQRPTSATDLEKYFCYGLSDNLINAINANREDALSETSSVCSESIDSYVGEESTSNETNELATSRLEKYFLHGFMGFTAERRDSDGSVGSDSEGRPSPEQRRKRLVRARGTGRSHSSSLDNLITNSDLSAGEPETQGSEHSSSSETDTYDECNNFDKSDGQFDTVKRKKCKKQKNVNGTNSPADEIKTLETTQELNEEDYQSDEDGRKTPQLEHQYATDFSGSRSKHQSRDSGFIGSCDDLIKEDKDSNSTEYNSTNKCEFKTELSYIEEEEKRIDERLPTLSTPPATSLTRKDSFNNWSSDEETNLMMCKMRQFFKTMVANNHNQSNQSSSKPTTPKLGLNGSPKPVPSPRLKTRSKPPQLIYFENELTRLMKTVPGIRDDQVREIVEYLSSEDTWSDSYDSSDYTSSDLEGAVCGAKSVLQQQISDSCKQIINKFETVDNEGDEGDGGIMDESHGFNRETAFVYQKLVASFEKMATGDTSNEAKKENVTSNSPPLIAKVMHHIGSRLVALMHEVSSGESHASNSPKTRHYHRRLQQKLSNASSTTTEDDDSPADTLAEKLTSLDDKMSYNLLPRSKSHDLLMGENKINHTNPTDITEERETSDCERFSWRGSFESALLATDSRNKLSLIGGEGSASASALAIAAKRRSAGDLLFSHKSLSREQLDRVRSCGSIGGANSEDKLWVASSNLRPGTRRRSSVPDASCGSGGSADGEDDEEEEQLEARSTLPRSLTAATTAGTTNSLPRLPTNGLVATPTIPTASASSGIFTKTQSVYHFLQNTNISTSSAGSVSGKSARYRAPGYNSRLVGTSSVPKRAVSAPGLQPTQHRRGRRSQHPMIPNDDVSLLSEAHSSPMLAAGRASKSSTPSPVPPVGSRLGGSASASLGGGGSTSGGDSPADWVTLGGSTEEDIDRLVAIHHQRTSLSSLGLRSDSMASVYSGAGDGRYGTVTVRGQVEFGLQYNYKAGALEILVKQCKDLAAVDSKRNRSDPYVKVYLLPDKSKGGKRKTKVRKHTLSPVFDECLRFHISLNGLETRTLWLTVWHSDMFGRNDFLGEVMMSLENKVFDDPTPIWYNLQERTEPFDEILSFKGDILVGLKFVPPDMTVHKKGKRSRGALHVLVKEAKSLTAIKANGLSDPFCKSYLLPEKGRGGKQKTAVVRRTVNPVWNHTFVYSDVTLQELAERCLELTVWDHDRLASNEFLGGVRFSMGTGKTYGKPVDWMDATGKEMSLWRGMLERPNFWVEGCLSLRPTLDHRSS